MFLNYAIMRYCSSDIRHESTWQQFLSALERNPHMHLSRYLRIHNVSQRGFEKWLYKKGYSVREAKDRVLQLQRESAIRESSLTEASSFLPIAFGEGESETARPVNILTGISLTLPDGTVISIRRGSAEAVVSFLKLYSGEDAPCSD
jgi:hypothetical protein